MIGVSCMAGILDNLCMKNQKRCAICGQFFVPDVRVEQRQKNCSRMTCQSKRKRKQEKTWREANAKYFADRYEYTKAWRKDHPDHQKQWREAKRREIQTQIPPPRPIKSIRLHLRLPLPIGEIQTQFVCLRQAGGDLWVDGALMHSP